MVLRSQCRHRRAVRPNPSVEARPNGRPPGPVWWYAYIFTSPGLASCRRSRLTSNVRPPRSRMRALVGSGNWCGARTNPNLRQGQQQCNSASTSAKAPVRTNVQSVLRGAAAGRGAVRLRLQAPWRAAAQLGGSQHGFAVHLRSSRRPNPSLKPSPNGGPPGPASRYRVHFLLAGPGVPPLCPA